jgi:agmatinase
MALAKQTLMMMAHFDAHSDTWDEYFGRKYNRWTTFKWTVEEGLLDASRCIQVGMRKPYSFWQPG